MDWLSRWSDRPDLDDWTHGWSDWNYDWAWIWNIDRNSDWQWIGVGFEITWRGNLLISLFNLQWFAKDIRDFRVICIFSQYRIIRRTYDSLKWDFKVHKTNRRRQDKALYLHWVSGRWSDLFYSLISAFLLLRSTTALYCHSVWLRFVAALYQNALWLCSTTTLCSYALVLRSITALSTVLSCYTPLLRSTPTLHHCVPRLQSTSTLYSHALR